MTKKFCEEAAFDLRESAVHLNELAEKLDSIESAAALEEFLREMMYDLGHVQEHICDAWHRCASDNPDLDSSHFIPNWDMEFELISP